MTKFLAQKLEGQGSAGNHCDSSYSSNREVLNIDFFLSIRKMVNGEINAVSKFTKKSNLQVVEYEVT